MNCKEDDFSQGRSVLPYVRICAKASDTASRKIAQKKC